MLAFALPALAAFTPYQRLKAARVQDVRSSALVSPLDGLAGRSLVVVLPQLGEFDSAEMCEQLVAVADDLQAVYYYYYYYYYHYYYYYDDDDDDDDNNNYYYYYYHYYYYYYSWRTLALGGDQLE